MHQEELIKCFYCGYESIQAVDNRVEMLHFTCPNCYMESCHKVSRPRKEREMPECPRCSSTNTYLSGPNGSIYGCRCGCTFYSSNSNPKREEKEMRTEKEEIEWAIQEAKKAADKESRRKSRVRRSRLGAFLVVLTVLSGGCGLVASVSCAIYVGILVSNLRLTGGDALATLSGAIAFLVPAVLFGWLTTYLGAKSNEYV